VNAVIQAYRFALDPTPEQDAVLRSHCGGQRFAFNWGLALVTAVMDQRKAEASYGIPDAELTPSLNWSAYSLRKLWNQAKDTAAPWWAENSKEAYSSGPANLATALGNWNASKAGKRRGRGFPGSRGSGRPCRIGSPPVGWGWSSGDRQHVRLPRIGAIRTLESTRKLARHVARGTARIRSATVSHRAGRWQVSFSVEITRNDPGPARPDPGPARPGSVAGVDLGVKSRWRKTQARIAAMHSAVANARRDGLHPPGTHPPHDRDRRPQRRRHDQKPAAGSPCSGCQDGGVTAPGRVQSPLVGCAGAYREQVVSQFQDLFGLWRGENQAAPVRTDIPLRRVRLRARSRSQRCPSHSSHSSAR
jgi:putative transposase